MQNNREIISKMENISTVLLDNAAIYYIPEFQRKFVWGTEEIDQLINDFMEDTQEFTVETNALEGYLLGNIVLIDQGNKKSIVDGQQRLTTLSLFSKAIHVVLSEHIAKAVAMNDMKGMQEWSKRVGEIEKGFHVLDDFGNPQGLKIQHDPSLAFGSYYRKLIDGTSDSNDILKEEDVNIGTVYDRIYDFLIGLDDSQFLKFIAYFRTKVKLIVTSAPTEAKAFQLFEILNDRGRSLEPMDLIKNTFLKVLTVEGKSQIQIDDFTRDWNGMMSNLQLDAKKKINSSTFLKQFLVAFKGENIKADNLFNYFKDPKNNYDGTTILSLVTNMNRVSNIYKKIESGKYEYFLQDQNMHILFKLLGIKQFHPLLMIFYDAEKQQKEEVLDKITKLGAVVLFSYTQTNYIEKILPEIIKKYWTCREKDQNKAYHNLILDIEEHIKDRAPIMRTALATRNFVGNNGDVNSKALMMLKFIELYFNRNTKIITVPKGRKVTVEHILSRNLDMKDVTNFDLGFDSDEGRKDNIHRLGNLTLLYNTENSSLGNSPFSDKVITYKNSDFILTSTLIEPVETGVKNGQDTRVCEYINKFEKQYEVKDGQWTKQLIDQRSEDLADLMMAIVLDKQN